MRTAPRSSLTRPLAFLAVTGFGPTAGAESLFVDCGEGSPFTLCPVTEPDCNATPYVGVSGLQAAIDAAQPGDDVVVGAGWECVDEEVLAPIAVIGKRRLIIRSVDDLLAEYYPVETHEEAVAPGRVLHLYDEFRGRVPQFFVRNSTDIEIRGLTIETLYSNLYDMGCDGNTVKNSERISFVRTRIEDAFDNILDDACNGITVYNSHRVFVSDSLIDTPHVGIDVRRRSSGTSLVGTVIVDPISGKCYDAVSRSGRNTHTGYITDSTFVNCDRAAIRIDGEWALVANNYFGPSTGDRAAGIVFRGGTAAETNNIMALDLYRDDSWLYQSNVYRALPDGQYDYEFLLGRFEPQSIEDVASTNVFGDGIRRVRVTRGDGASP